MARKVRQRSGGESGVADRGAGKPSLYQEVTDRIIRELEQGRVPWVQPLQDSHISKRAKNDSASGT